MLLDKMTCVGWSEIMSTYNKHVFEHSVNSVSLNGCMVWIETVF